MAQVTITIPDALIPRISAAMRSAFPQYSALTDVQCFKQITADHWRAILGAYEGQRAGASAEAAASAAYNQALSDGSGIG